MKNKKLSFQLNVIHISHFTLLLVVVLFVNFILLKSLVTHNIQKVFKANGVELVKSVNQNFDIIEETSEIIVGNIIPPNILPENIVDIAKLNTLIRDIQIVNLNNEIDSIKDTKIWTVTLTDDTIIQCNYHRIINEQYQLLIELNENWFDIILSEKFVFNSSDINLFNSYFNLHIRPDLKSLSDVFEYENENILTRIDSTGVFFKKINFVGSSESYFSFISYIPKIKLYFSLNRKQNEIFIFRGRYPAFISLIFIFLIFLSIYIIILTNKKYLKPYGDILNSFEHDQFVNISKSSNEPVLIKRSIELLQNQLKFYVNNLEKTSSESKKIENDLKIAQKLQSNILPTDTTEISKHQEFKISAMSEAAFDIGGDLYDYYLLDESHLLFVVGDVSGKGIPAALFMIYTQTLLRSIAKPNMKVSDIIENLNNKLVEENISDLFVTMLLGILDIKTGVLSFCNAAHNLPIIIHQEGSIQELEESHGIPVGIYANRKYKNADIQLNENDQVLIYTDGVIDTVDENGMNYSIDVLKYNLMGTWFHSPQITLNKIQKSVTEFRGNIDPVDDMTILILQYNNKINI